MFYKKQKFRNTALLCGTVSSLVVGTSGTSAFNKKEKLEQGKSSGSTATVSAFNKKEKLEKGNSSNSTTTLTSAAAIASSLAAAVAGFFTLKTNETDTNNGSLSDERTVEKVNSDDFFEKFTGYTEQEFRKNPKYVKSCIKKNEDGSYSIFHKNGKEFFSAGKVDILNMKHLNKVVDEKLKNINYEESAYVPGEIDVIGINKSFSSASKELKEKIDVSFLQSKKENKNKTFVVASNFNAIETLGPNDSTSRKYITDYFYDHTQGPAAALSAMPGTILRHYGMFFDEKKNPENWRQTDSRQINLLNDLGIRTRNGYIEENIDKIKEVTEKLKNGELRDKFKICYHSGIQVTSNDVFNEENTNCFYDKDQKIDQIYIAGVSLSNADVSAIMNYSKKNGVATDKSFHYFYQILCDFAKEVVKLSVEATLKSTFEKGRKEVFLTLIGCGVFNNDPKWLLDALEENKDFIRKSGIKVVLNLPDAITKSPGLYNEITKLVKKINLGNNVLSKIRIFGTNS